MSGCDDRRAKQAMAALFEKGRDGLDAEGFRRLRAHLATCPDCQETYTRLSRVESVLERRALPQSRSAHLEQALFARLQPAPARAVVTSERRRWFSSPLFMPLALGAAAATVALVVVAPTLERQAPRDAPEWQARSSAPGEGAWGVRAFCVSPEGTVLAEARPGGTLTCAEGNAVQFSYTAPERARLSLEGLPAGGEPLRFFPSEGPAPEVAAGVDVTLPFSTPVQGGWLTGPVPVRARFTDAQGRTVADTQVTLLPR
ncbi:anti-sigma factor family protein [Corallococcus coralloides]|uniref:anti-sigma factor family protein n=1 Tax=Corallococcus coralloides TaxID=184914 RepID=UPI00384BF551